MNVTRTYLDELLSTLTERDLAIADVVGRFKLVSGGQIERLFFDHCSERSRARNRQAVVRRLVERQVLVPVGKRRKGGEGGGSAATVYALDVAGHRLVEFTGTRPRRPYTHYEPTMAHYLLVTELYVRLVEAERAGQLTLLTFEAEPYCWRSFADRTLKPDAFVQIGIEIGGQRRKGSCFIEIDRADQWGAKISSKMPQYLAYRDYERPNGRPFPRVLFLTVHERRATYLTGLIQKQAPNSTTYRAGLFDDALMLLVGEEPARATA